MKRRSALTEKILVAGFQYPEEKIVAVRRGLGIDGGRSELIEHLRADPGVRETCREYETMFGLARPAPLR